VNVKVVIHDAAEGGYWAEVAALPGCASQGESMDELLANTREAIEAWLAAGETDEDPTPAAMVMELAV